MQSVSQADLFPGMALPSNETKGTPVTGWASPGAP